MIDMKENNIKKSKMLIELFQYPYIIKKMADDDKIRLQNLIDSIDTITSEDLIKFTEDMYVKSVIDGHDYNKFLNFIRLKY